MRLLKHKPTSRHRHAAARTYGWSVFMHWFANRESPENIPNHQAPTEQPSVGSGRLPALPPGAMPQRTVKLPKMPARTAFPAEVQAAARRVAIGVASRPAYRIDPDMPLFRDERTLTEYEDRYQERVRRIQHLHEHAWPDGHGVNLGSDQSPKTITFSTADYREFAGDQGRKAVSR